TRNPLLNAAAATAYIAAISSALYYVPKTMNPAMEGPIVPAAFLSLFVLSAAMMVYFFLYQPAQLFFENKSKEAAELFLSTVIIFALVTGVIISILLFLSMYMR
ncbi:MAG: hypothetical protein WCW36_03260, partial [Candidatus Paceibacterota bacterium]